MGRETSIAWLFPGQSSQRVGMGQRLYEQHQEVRDLFNIADDVVKETFGEDIDLARLCFEGPGEKLEQTKYAQPAVTAVELAYLKDLQIRGIKPQHVSGHSLGQIPALVAVGSLQPREAIEISANRGLFLKEASNEHPSKMMAVLGLTEKGAQEICKQTGAEIANINLETQLVLVVPLNAEAETKKQVILNKGKIIDLKIDTGSHYKGAEKAKNKLQQFLEDKNIQPPQLPFISDIWARRLQSATEVRNNLADQLTSTVEWFRAVKLMIADGANTFYEVGPGNTLTNIVKKIAPNVEIITFDQ